MRAWRSQLANTWAALLLAGCMAAPAAAQLGADQAGSKQSREAGARADGARTLNRAMRRMERLPSPWMERMREMPPAEQERFMNNSERFKNLPPERQVQIRKRLQDWNRLAPEQRVEIRKRAQIWRQMSPEQRRYLRAELLPKWQQLAPARRQVILGKLHVLHNLSDSERAAKWKEPNFLQGLNPDERVLLRELSNLRAVGPPEPPPEH